MSTAPLKIAIAGAGYWGRNLLRTFSRVSDARVIELCDLDAAALAELARTHPGVRTGTAFAELLRRDDVDAVAIATPPSRHHAMALAALCAGRHVWVEKPLALSATEGSELVAAAAASGRVLFVDETFLYDPLVREMKRLIDTDALGDVYHLSFERLGMGRIRRDSDVWWNSAPHDLSILLHLVPRRVTRVQLHLHAYLQRELADYAVCDLELEGGVSAHVYLSWLHPQKTATVTVVGRQRMLAYEGRFENRALTLYDYALDRDTAAAASTAAPIIPVSRFTGRVVEVPSGEPLLLAAEHFVDCIASGREPLSSGARSLRVVEVLEAAHRHATHDGTPA